MKDRSRVKGKHGRPEEKDGESGGRQGLDEHEVRNLLFLIISFSTLLQDGKAGPLTPRQAEYLGHVLESAEQMRTLLDQRADPDSGTVTNVSGPDGVASQ